MFAFLWQGRELIWILCIYLMFSLLFVAKSEYSWPILAFILSCLMCGFHVLHLSCMNLSILPLGSILLWCFSIDLVEINLFVSEVYCLAFVCVCFGFPVQFIFRLWFFLGILCLRFLFIEFVLMTISSAYINISEFVIFLGVSVVYLCFIMSEIVGLLVADKNNELRVFFILVRNSFLLKRGVYILCYKLFQ